MKRSALLIIGIVLCALAADAQQGDLNFINFSSKNGLSSNSVNSIIRDRYGYMWFATEDGLNKFDGVNFTVYRHDDENPKSIGAGAVTALCEDSSGNLWVGVGKTLSKYNREKDDFINHLVPQAAIRSLCADHTGNIWIGTYGGLFLFNDSTKSRNNFEVKPGGVAISVPVLALFEDSRNRLWIGTNEGLYVYTAHNHQLKKFLHDDNDPASIPGNVIRAVTEDFSGNIWFGTKENGICVLMADGHSFKSFSHSNSDVSTISNDRLFCMSPDNEGKIWVGTEDGLNIFDPVTANVTRINSDQRNKYGFTGKSIRSIYIDKDGIYWVGTFRAGVNKYDKNLVFFNHRQSNAFDPFGLRSSNVTCFVENDNGDIYMGTDGGGLHLLKRETGLFEHPALEKGNNQKAQAILAIDRLGDELWIGTYPDGVYVKSISTGATRHFVKGNGPNDLPGNEIFCVKKDSRGNVWIGTNGTGVVMYDSRARVFRRFDSHEAKTASNLVTTAGFIRTISEDRFGNIWIGSHGGGITIYDPWRNVFSNLTHDNSKLAYDFVMSIFASKDGTMWVGTAGEGLCRYNYKTGEFESFSEADGLINGFVYSIIEDESGKLWLSTNKGISCFDPKNRKFKNYSSYNGVQQSSFCGGAGLLTKTGDIFFGGLDGFNYFRPQAFPATRKAPALVFTDLKVDNRSVVPGDDASIKKHISITREVRLNYKQNFSIDFVALNYTSPGESRYAYKLDGFDKNWIDAGTSKTAVYTNLPPGKYSFRLKAQSDDGTWVTPETSIDIYVKPPFWRTGYAYLFYFIVIVLALWLVRYRGIKKLESKFAVEQERLRNQFALEKERQEFQQMLEQERREAEQKHEMDEIRIKFLTNLSHELRTPVSLILSPAEQLLGQESNDQKKTQLGIIRRNAKRLLNLVNQLLDFRKLEEAELKLNLAECDLVAFSREVSESFKDVSIRRNINFSFTSTLPDYPTMVDRDKIERILFNLLSNAFKFTKEHAQITLKVEARQPHGVRIIVADTGIGMDNDTREKIFERFFQGDADPAILNQGNGIGLSITREFVRLHGGTIDVESLPGKGTTFLISLPCQRLPGIVKESITPLIESETTAPVPSVADETANAQKPVLLLIDDNEDFLHYLSTNLQADYKIVEARDGKQGWQKVLSTHPQVIVSDISMPEMDGISLCRKIRSDKRTRHIPIILLTALTGDTHQVKGLDTGANDYLTKPFNFEILNLKVKNLLNLNLSLKKTYTRQIKITGDRPEAESGDEILLRSVIQFIENNLDSPELSVEEMGRHVGMSRGVLYKKILALTGETPVEFIRTVKMDKAAGLLEHTDLKISEVGYRVGFTAPNYFARVFKEKFNLTPSEFARIKRKPD